MASLKKCLPYCLNNVHELMKTKRIANLTYNHWMKIRKKVYIRNYCFIFFFNLNFMN